MVKNNIKVIYKELNNKSRKGLYAYVKEKGKRPSYYKVKNEIGKKDKIYRDIYTSGGIKSPQGVTKKVIKERRRAKKIFKKYPNIEESFRKGEVYAGNTIESAHKMSVFGVRTAYMNLLRNKDKDGDKLGVIRDKQLLQIITLPENVEKWKHRVMYKINLYDQNNDIMATISPDNVKTLTDIRKEVMGKIILGQEFSTMYKDLNDTVKKNGYKMTSDVTMIWN